ncbi:MAG: APC family permease [Planctomycetota bacterium]
MNADTPREGLLRVLGPGGATAIVVGGTIGAGIFFKANVIAQALGRFDLILLVWLVCGLVSLCGALTVAELAALMPHAGGQYVYLRQAYGPLAGFLWGWGEFWVLRTGSIAALAVAFANAFQRSASGWLASHHWLVPLQEDPSQLVISGDWTIGAVWVPRLVAIMAILLLTMVNIVGARWGGLVQNITTILKAATLAALILLPFVTGQVDHTHLSSRWHPAEQPGIWAGFAAAMTAAFWAYDGWANVSLVSEEVRDPQRNLPLALALGTLILIILYVCVTIGYHVTLPMAEIAASKFVAATACELTLGNHGAAIASAAVMISTFGALNTNLLCGPRVIFAMARHRLFLAPFASIHPRFRTPYAAICAEASWAIALICGGNLLKYVQAPQWLQSWPAWLATPLTKSLNQMRGKELFDVLTDYVIFGSFIFYLLSVAAVFVLRRREPDRPRPYRTWGYPLVPILFVGISSCFLAGMLITAPIEALAGLAFITLGATAYQFRSQAIN